MLKSARKKSNYAEAEFDFWKSNNEMLDQLVNESLKDRISPNSASRKMVSHVSLARYFRMLELGRAHLKDLFTMDEIVIMANVNPQPWWQGDMSNERYCRIIDAVYSYYADDDGNCPQEIYFLLRKLQGLDLMERLALVDALESAYRNKKIFNQIVPE